MRPEAERFWQQALEDLATARLLGEGGRSYASAFFAQQAAEKALKAAAVERVRVLPRTHDLIDIAEQVTAPAHVVDAARLLTPDYLLTRYPDVAGTIPARLYTNEDATKRLEAAQRVLTWAQSQLGMS